MIKNKKFEKEILKNLVNDSKTYSEVLEKLGLRSAGGNFTTLKKYIKKYELNIEHFDPQKIRIDKLKKNTENYLKEDLKDYLVVNSNYNRGHLKKRLYSEGLKRPECELCGQGEIWKGKKMSLILDHINGIWNDNRLENLQIVCPNCNATLDTHCGKNLRKKIISQQDIEKKELEKKKNIYNSGLKRRTVERPPYEDLKKDVWTNGYSAVGRKYGVSDNSIRKWIKSYEKNK
jgi:hypothetical protein